MGQGNFIWKGDPKYRVKATGSFSNPYGMGVLALSDQIAILDAKSSWIMVCYSSICYSLITDLSGSSLILVKILKS